MSVEPILPLIPPDPASRVTDCTSDRPALPGLDPEQVGAPVAGAFSGVSEATWWRLHAAAKVPRPNKLGGRTLWQLNGPNGLQEWIRQGCPSRAEFEARQSAQQHGRA